MSSPGEIPAPIMLGPAFEYIKKKLNSRIAAYLNACVRCGLCADTCHFFLADKESDSIPARKIERMSRIFRRYGTLLGRMFPVFVGSRAVDENALRELTDAVFGRCTMCGRCALNCSVGLDPASIIRFARSVLVEAGLVPKGIQANVDNYVKTGNSMG